MRLLQDSWGQLILWPKKSERFEQHFKTNLFDKTWRCCDFGVLFSYSCASADKYTLKKWNFLEFPRILEILKQDPPVVRVACQNLLKNRRLPGTFQRSPPQNAWTPVSLSRSDAFELGCPGCPLQRPFYSRPKRSCIVALLSVEAWKSFPKASFCRWIGNSEAREHWKTRRRNSGLISSRISLRVFSSKSALIRRTTRMQS